MAVNLTTRFHVKQYAGISNTADDALIDILITQVSTGIATWCDRIFELTDYKEWRDGTGDNDLLLRNFPITRIYAMAIDTDDSGEIQFTGTGQMATVQIDGDTMSLTTVVSGTLATQTVDLLANATLTAVQTAVAALGSPSGWVYTLVSDFGDKPSAFLKPLYGEDALSPEDADIDVAEDPQTVKIAAEGAQSIERPGGGRFPPGRGNILIWYRAGFTLPAPVTADTEVDVTTKGDVPTDLTLTTNSIIKNVLDASKEAAGNMKSEKFDHYTYTMSDGGQTAIADAIQDHAAALVNHKSMRLY